MWCQDPAPSIVQTTTNFNLILKVNAIDSLKLSQEIVMLICINKFHSHSVECTKQPIPYNWPSMSSDLNPIEHLWGILKRKVERKVSNIHQLCDVIVEEWKRTPEATCEALVNSMPKRVKAVLENNGGHTKY